MVPVVVELLKNILPIRIEKVAKIVIVYKKNISLIMLVVDQVVDALEPVAKTVSVLAMLLQSVLDETSIPPVFVLIKIQAIEERDRNIVKVFIVGIAAILAPVPAGWLTQAKAT